MLIFQLCRLKEFSLTGSEPFLLPATMFREPSRSTSPEGSAQEIRDSNRSIDVRHQQICKLLSHSGSSDWKRDCEERFTKEFGFRISEELGTLQEAIREYAKQGPHGLNEMKSVVLTDYGRVPSIRELKKEEFDTLLEDIQDGSAADSVSYVADYAMECCALAGMMCFADCYRVTPFSPVDAFELFSSLKAHVDSLSELDPATVGAIVFNGPNHGTFGQRAQSMAGMGRCQNKPYDNYRFAREAFNALCETHENVSVLMAGEASMISQVSVRNPGRRFAHAGPVAWTTYSGFSSSRVMVQKRNPGKHGLRCCILGPLELSKDFVECVSNRGEVDYVELIGRVIRRENASGRLIVMVGVGDTHFEMSLLARWLKRRESPWSSPGCDSPQRRLKVSKTDDATSAGIQRPSSSSSNKISSNAQKDA